MTSVLNVDTIADKAGTGPVGLTKQHAAKAWSQYEGDGTVSITGSFNQSGLSDNGTGDYTLSLTNSMSDAAYAMTSSGTHDSGAYYAWGAVDHDNNGYQASSCRMNIGDNDGNPEDAELIAAVIHGDLA